MTRWLDVDLLVLDTETTGVDPGVALCSRCAVPLGSATDEPLCPVHRRVREREVRGG